MMKHSTAIFFYIDALDLKLVRHSRMPFLSSLVTVGGYHTRRLGSVLGYSFAIQSCMFSGKHPDESGQWLPYRFSDGRPPLLFKALARYGNPLLLDHSPKLRFLMMELLRKSVMRRGVQANNIPLSVIRNFAIFPYYYPYELPSFRELKDLVLCRYNTQLTYLGPPRVKGDSVYDSLARLVSQSTNAQFVMVYEDRLDAMAHRSGPTSSSYRTMAKHVDDRLELACQIAASACKDPILVFFSDHAQTNLRGCVDIMANLAEAGFELGKDYLCFVDATIALFWAEEESMRLGITDSLQKLRVGTVIDGFSRKRYHVCFENKRLYGDIIYVLRPGWSFFPNFFTPRKPMNGLHGYMPDEEVQKAFIIADERVSVDCQHVKDIRDVILECCRLVH